MYFKLCKGHNLKDKDIDKQCQLVVIELMPNMKCTCTMKVHMCSTVHFELQIKYICTWFFVLHYILYLRVSVLNNWMLWECNRPLILLAVCV